MKGEKVKVDYRLSKNDVEDIVALSPMQEGLLYHYRMEQNSNQYCQHLILDIEGRIDIEKLKTTWMRVQKINESLRSIFRWKNMKNSVQVILKQKTLPLHIHDFREYSFHEANQKVEMEKKHVFAKPIPIDLEPFCITIYLITDSSAVMVFSYHHILLDGWSLVQLLHEFINLYENENSAEIVLPKPKLKQTAKWLLQRDKISLQDFWKDYLHGSNAQTLIPVNSKAISDDKNTNSAIYNHKLTFEKTDEILNFVKSNSFTLSSTLLAAWGILTQIYNDTDDVLIGTVVSGRKAPIIGIENLVGVLSNTIPFRVRDNGKDTVRQFINRVHENYISLEPYENTPLVDIKSYSGIDSRNSLFDTLIVIENYPLHDLLEFSTDKSIQIKSFEFIESNHFPLTLTLMVVNGKLEFNFTYNPEVFQSSIIKRIIELYESIINKFISQSESRLGAINWISDNDKNLLINSYNTTDHDYKNNCPIPTLLESQAKRWPNRIALVCNQEEISYSELDNLVNRIANGLLDKGVQPEEVIGIMMPRSINLVASMLGIMRAGCAYMPIDQKLPLDRIQYMCSNAGVKHLILDNGDTLIVSNVISHPIDELEKYPSVKVKVNVALEQLAYVIYTSGSTGVPKGVMVTHKAILNRLNWSQTKYQLTLEDTILQKTPISFDVSVWELFWWIFGGAKLCLLTPGKEGDPSSLIQHLYDNNITIIHFVPSMLGYFLDYLERNPHEIKKLKSLQRIFTSGESIKLSHVERINKLLTIPNGTKVTNMYGPTEATVEVSYYDVNDIEEGLTSIPIGKPISNVNLHILDRNMKLQPIGAIGELYISGVCLAKGYINQPQLTSEKFIQHPWNKDELIYRTGDKAIQLPNGNIQFLGRDDDQVKIRGYRIEIGEIEEALLSVPLVNDALVLKVEKDDDVILHAFVISSEELEAENIRKVLLEKLPEYMVPNYFHKVLEFAKTPSGKIDRLAMVKNIKVQSNNSKSLSPESETERKLISIWSEVLDLSNIGVHDNFFEVGGHSLSLLKVQMMIQDVFGSELTVSDMFRLPTIKFLAEYLDGKNQENTVDIQEQQSQNQIDNDIAIIGIAGRFPGADNTEEFWGNLVEGIESIHFFSDEELVNSGIPEEQIRNPKYVKASGIINDAEFFDAEFFNMSPVETEMTDPQQRLLLECSWEALENAGYNPFEYKNKIGLFAGTSMSTYLVNQLLPLATSRSLDEYRLMLGNDKDFLTTRVSHKLNLRGPSLAIQTACSSSLVAVHVACQSLLNRECTISLAGGVSVEIPQNHGYLYQEEGIRSPDGHCRAFDEGASGTVRGSGVGMVVLKRLNDAIKDGDHIYSIIKGSSVNNDGAVKVGYTAPGVEGQAEVIMDAHNRAGVNPEQITYVETHGTGTSLGDPIEIAALTKAFRKKTDKYGYCAIGSVKTNIGHLDAAAGIAGLIKTVLAIYNRELPPSLHFQSPNPKIDFETSPFYVNNLYKKWESPISVPRRAGVSSFGIGGTNAHVVLEEFKSELKNDSKGRTQTLIVLSGKSENSIIQNKKRLAYHLRKHPDINPADIAFTLQVGRAAFDTRQYLLVKDRDDLIKKLEQSEQNKIANIKENSPIAFYFTDQDSAYIGMGRELYETQEYFCEQVNLCSQILSPLIGYEINKVLYPGERKPIIKENISNTLTAPMLFTIEYSLAKFLIRIGIIPNCLIGNSVSEITSACLSGVFSLEEALWLVTEREKVSQLTFADFTQQSSQLNRLKKELHQQLAKKVTFNAPNIPFYSNISEDWITDEQATSSEYWIQNIFTNAKIRHCLQFIENFHSILIRLGSDNNDTNMINTANVKLNTLASYEDKNSDMYYLLNTIGKLWMLGFNPDWNILHERENRRRCPLPTSYFERKRYMLHGEKNLNVLLNQDSNDIYQTFVANWSRAFKSINRIVATNGLSFIISEEENELEEELKYKLEVLGKTVFILKKEHDFNWEVVQGYLKNIEVPVSIFDIRGLYSKQPLIASWRDLYKRLSAFDGKLNYILVGDKYYNITGIDKIIPSKTADLELYLGNIQKSKNIMVKVIDIPTPDKISYDIVNLLIQEAEIKESHKQIVGYRGGKRWIRSYQNIKLPQGANLRTDLQKVFLVISLTSTSDEWLLLEKYSEMENINIVQKNISFNGSYREEEQDYSKLILQVKEKFGHIDGIIFSLNGSELLRGKSFEEWEHVISLLDLEVRRLQDSIRDLILDYTVILLTGLKKYTSVLHAFTSSVANVVAAEGEVHLWNSVYIEGSLESLEINHMKEILGNIDTIIFDMEPADWVISIKDEMTLVTNKQNVKDDLKTFYSRPKQSNEYIEPRDYVEKFIAQVWQELLHIDQIGVNDHFLELGGNSLYGLQIVSRLREVFQVEYMLEDLFTHPTISTTYKKLESIWGNKEILEEIVKVYNEIILTTR